MAFDRVQETLDAPTNAVRTSNRAEALSVYAARSRLFSMERQHYERIAGRIANARAAMFVLGLGCWIAAYDAQRPMQWLLMASGSVLATAFLVLLFNHARVRARIRLRTALEQVSKQAYSRARRDWGGIPSIDWVGTSSEHPCAADLDVFGHASLFKLVNIAATVPGRRTVRDWLLQPAGVEQIALRQEAVAELAPCLDLRDEFAARARGIGREQDQALSRFLEWAEGDQWLSRKRVLIWFSRCLPILTLAFIAMNIVGLVPYFTWVSTIGVGLFVSWRQRVPISEVFTKTSSSGVSLARYGPLFDLLSTASFESGLLQRIATTLTADGRGAGRHMSSLARSLACADTRYSHFLHVTLQALLLWDFHVVYALEKWQRAAGPSVREWVSTLGEFEALASFAALKHAHPGWVFARVSDDQHRIVEAQQLGHPLLSPSSSVLNDVTIGPPGAFLFVTGSNMSGKSTLLRAIGLNVVLAQAGAPVCASAMRLPALRLFTSMRMTDSLERGVSQYLAQLERIKVVVEAARTARREGDTLLYLFDEVLQGTNVAERLVAVRHILGVLVGENAIGVVASHDLAIPEADGLSTAYVPVHFREEVRSTAHGPVMTFDYTLRPGLATSTNALKLMQIMGLR